MEVKAGNISAVHGQVLRHLLGHCVKVLNCSILETRCDGRAMHPAEQSLGASAACPTTPVWHILSLSQYCSEYESLTKGLSVGKETRGPLRNGNNEL